MQPQGLGRTGGWLGIHTVQSLPKKSPTAFPGAQKGSTGNSFQPKREVEKSPSCRRHVYLCPCEAALGALPPPPWRTLRLGATVARSRVAFCCHCGAGHPACSLLSHGPVPQQHSISSRLQSGHCTVGYLGLAGRAAALCGLLSQEPIPGL